MNVTSFNSQVLISEHKLSAIEYVRSSNFCQFHFLQIIRYDSLININETRWYKQYN